MVAFGWVLPVRAFQILFAIVCLGCFGYLVNQQQQFDNVTFTSFQFAEVNYGLFTAIFGLLSLIYLVLVAFMFSSTIMANAFIIVGLEALNWIFWLACFAANAAKLSSFGYISRYLDGTTQWHDWVAATVFAAFEWLLFCATLIAAVMVIVKGKDSKMAGGIAGSGV